MAMKILQIGDDRLLKQSNEIVDFEDPKLQKFIDDMLNTCEEGRDFTAGLAAPQVGNNTKLTVVRSSDFEIDDLPAGPGKSVWVPILNPVIVNEDQEYVTTIWEACLSIGIGPKQLNGPVTRSSWVKVEYSDRYGKKHTIKGKGFQSHLLQHEMDHLNGVLFTSKVPNPDKNLWLSSDLDKHLKEFGDYPDVL